MGIQAIIESKLGALQPQFLQVENESHRHNVPQYSESHFNVTVVSMQFKGETLLARHRIVNQILSAELATSVHALAVHAMTPDEWQDKNQMVTASPPCLGGSTSKK